MVMNALVIKVSTTEQADGHEYHNHLKREEGGGRMVVWRR